MQSLTTIAAVLMTNMILGSPEPVRFGLKLESKYLLERKIVRSRAQRHIWLSHVRPWGVFSHFNQPQNQQEIKVSITNEVDVVIKGED